jgi:hypothetical protein
MISSPRRFDVVALRELAGEKVFSRGEAYHLQGKVEILSIDSSRVRAQVTGTEDYRTEITGGDCEIAGSCSCPAFDDTSFCKHMVAVALAANAAAEPEGIGALARIEEYLRSKSVDVLVKMIVTLVDRDPALFRKLDMAASIMSADDKTLEARLRKAIDEGTRTRGYIEYRAVSRWATGVAEVLDLIEDLVLHGRSIPALRLAEHAIDRIESAMESIDDSDGYCGGLLCRARDIHLSAACAVVPEPVSFAKDLFAREMKGEYGAFDGASIIYADVLGTRGLAEYRRLAAEAWEKLPPKVGLRAARGSFAPDIHTNYPQLLQILDGFAENDGDVDARISLRAKDLSSPWQYQQLVEFCLSHDRADEALRHAEEGLWIFEDHGANERLVTLTAGLLSRAGRQMDAEKLLLQVFEKAANYQLYLQLCEIGGSSAGQAAMGLLQSRLRGKRSTRGASEADLLVHIMTHEKAFGDAWAIVRKHGVSSGARETLAKASEASHPREAIETYAERIDQLADSGGSVAYEEVVKLLLRMAALRSAEEQAAHVAALKLRFGRKRNLLKLLG